MKIQSVTTAERVMIVHGKRTPFVRAKTVFRDIPASILGGITLRETVASSGIDPKEVSKIIEEIYFGIVCPPSEGTNISRECLFDSGLSPTIPCTTINRYCASAGEAIGAIAAKISSGQIHGGVAGGVESISSMRALFSAEATDFFQNFSRAKTFSQKIAQLSQFKIKFLTPHAPGIKEPTTGLTMGQSADLMARLFEIKREDQDRYALESHQKAHQAWEKGFYKNQVISVTLPKGRVIDRDTDIRSDSSLNKLSQLPPVFYPDGTITAANASPLTDGAAAVLLLSESKTKELGLKPIGILRSVAAAGVDIQKEPLLIGPAYAIPQALDKAGVKWHEIDLIEMHEAFAAQVLSTLKALEPQVGETDLTRLNVNGGSIAIGHPFGATGARLVLQALYELQIRKKNLGLISICAAGGLGLALVVEAL